jgi:drug/metabolite transporter (DMT)-like permease
MKTESLDSERKHDQTLAPAAGPATWQLLAAFGAIYIIWGSTYLAIRYAVETIPPFVMAGTRAIAAGSLLYVFARRRGAAAPTRREWRDAAIAGGLMLTIGNGAVTWAEMFIPSGVTALLVALVPLWMVLLEWWRPGGVRPQPLVLVGLAVGFGGVALLARSHTHSGGAVHTWGVMALMAASMGWAMGAIYNRRSLKPGSPLLAVGMQMIAGGVLLLGFAALHGEAATFSLSRITLVSAASWFYLTIMGSLIGFTAYVWLLQVSTPARVSTSAYVNPLIAVLLGSTIGREPFSSELVIAGALIIVAVVMIVRSSRSKATTNGRSIVRETKVRAVIGES